ncbi:MAG: methyltransferase [Bdellovibrionales bacterium RBG_16_40_8]|nr:MAG: methyltransferase [Bdellovibrionales bacterium RBG_16_40_8]
MTAKNKQPVYIHGYSKEEQDRLYRQAEFMEFLVYRDVNFSQIDNIVEVGCGVGAQTQILLRRFPHLKSTCIDINDSQLKVAKRHLQTLGYAKDRYIIHKMSAEKMTFSDSTFQGAFLCWILEHVPSPSRILSEVRRVLAPGANIYITEVMNFSFFLDPYCPAIWKFWMTLNDCQYDRGGDPFVGVKLGNFLRDTGFTDVHTKMLTLYVDKREPELREKVILHWQDLIMSAVDELVSQSRVTRDHVLAMKKEFKDILKNPNAILFDSFMQAQARVP